MHRFRTDAIRWSSNNTSPSPVAAIAISWILTWHFFSKSQDWFWTIESAWLQLEKENLLNWPSSFTQAKKQQISTSWFHSASPKRTTVLDPARCRLTAWSLKIPWLFNIWHDFRLNIETLEPLLMKSYKVLQARCSAKRILVWTHQLPKWNAKKG